MARQARIFRKGGVVSTVVSDNDVFIFLKCTAKHAENGDKLFFIDNRYKDDYLAYEVLLTSENAEPIAIPNYQIEIEQELGSDFRDVALQCAKMEYIELFYDGKPVPDFERYKTGIRITPRGKSLVKHSS